MLNILAEYVLPYIIIIGIVVHQNEKLTKKEQVVQAQIMAKLGVAHIKLMSPQPTIIAMVGLVGSGKSSVADLLAGHISALVVKGDTIRTALRREGERYERTRAIAENIALEVVKHSSNVILDSDFIDRKKRASIREKARKAGVRLVFIRTHCDFDVMLERICTNDSGEFFNNASSLSKAPDKGKYIKMRELDRRKPHHYRWLNQGGGKWIPKKLPFSIYCDIDTTNRISWTRHVELCAEKLFPR